MGVVFLVGYNPTGQAQEHVLQQGTPVGQPDITTGMIGLADEITPFPTLPPLEPPPTVSVVPQPPDSTAIPPGGVRLFLPLVLLPAES